MLYSYARLAYYTEYTPFTVAVKDGHGDQK